MTAAGGRVRIIAGRWRGSKLAVGAGVRPSADRVRETLFNWLQPWIHGASCLDLFAGSGALGFEAVSRGAAHALLIDSSAAVVAALRESARVLGTDAVEVRQRAAQALLSQPAAAPYDIVFLDPPFRQGLLAPSLARLADGGWLAPGGLIYVEADRHEELPALPGGWQEYRMKTAGQVRFGLLRAP